MQKEAPHRLPSSRDNSHPPPISPASSSQHRSFDASNSPSAFKAVIPSRLRAQEQPSSPGSPARSRANASSSNSAVPKREADIPSNTPSGSYLNVVWRFWCGLCDGLALLHVWQMLRGSRPMWNAVRDTMVFFCVWMGLFLFLNLFVSRWVRVLLGDDDQKWVFDQVVMWTWLVPLYLLSMILSFVRYQEIAVGACQFKKRRCPPPSEGLGAWRRFLESMGDEARRLVVVGLFLGGAKLLQALPTQAGFPMLGNLLYGVCSAWTVSFYAFEYVWTFLGWSLHDRIRFFEQRWAYFCGFGAPLACATGGLSFFPGTALYATAFPLFIMLAAAAQCKPYKDPTRLRLFMLPSLLATFITRLFVRTSSVPD